MTQPEALRLADKLCNMADDGDMGRKPDPKCSKRQAAAELRRLHAVNQELLKACRTAIVALKGREHDGFLRAAIAKAEGGTS
jgi:hypothetical protein